MTNLENRMIIEERFEYEGLSCLVVFYPHGYRCGYAGVKEDSR